MKLYVDHAWVDFLILGYYYGDSHGAHAVVAYSLPLQVAAAIVVGLYWAFRGGWQYKAASPWLRPVLLAGDLVFWTLFLGLPLLALAGAIRAVVRYARRAFEA